MAGQIIKRGERNWVVRVFTGRDASGKRQYLNQTIHGTKKDAQGFLNDALKKQDLGVALKMANQTAEAYLNQWLEEAARQKVRERTFDGYARNLRSYVIPAIGAKPLQKVTSLEIQAIYNGLLERGLSPRTIQYTHMILKQALNQAIRWRLLVFNPCDGATVPRQRRKEMEALSPEQSRRFIAAAKMDRYFALFEVAITSGLRPSEYLSLKWCDINWARGTVSIVRSIDFYPNGRWEIAENKTGRSRRLVRLHAPALASLRDWRTAQEEERKAAGETWIEHDFIFTNAAGGPVDKHNLTRRHFRKILKTAGLPEIRLYDLRHTAATLALSAGVPIKVVSEQLGHASSALTMDVYSHVMPDLQEESVQRVERLLLTVDCPKDAGHSDPRTRSLT